MILGFVDTAGETQAAWWVFTSFFFLLLFVVDVGSPVVVFFVANDLRDFILQNYSPVKPLSIRAML